MILKKKFFQKNFSRPGIKKKLIEKLNKIYLIKKNPMDLSTIQLKINNKIYKSRREFISDLELIVQNCLTYNGDDTCKYFNQLKASFLLYFVRLFRRIEST